MHILPDAPRKGIVINTAELRLYYYDAEDGYFSYPLGVGRDGFLTPLGTTKIVRKKEKAVLVPDAFGDPRSPGAAALFRRVRTIRSASMRCILGGRPI